MKCQANRDCTSEATSMVTVEREPTITRVPCCFCCTSYLRGYWMGRGRHVTIAEIANLRREWN